VNLVGAKPAARKPVWNRSERGNGEVYEELGFVEANVAFALWRPDMYARVADTIESLVREARVDRR
jgi:hypothetical protein